MPTIATIQKHATSFRYYAVHPGEVRDIFAFATDEELRRFWTAIAEIADSAADMLTEIESLKQSWGIRSWGIRS